MNATDIIYAEAMEALAAYHGQNEFYSREEALARLNAVVNMALQLELLTENQIEAAKSRAKADYKK